MNQLIGSFAYSDTFGATSKAIYAIISLYGISNANETSSSNGTVPIVVPTSLLTTSWDIDNYAVRV